MSCCHCHKIPDKPFITEPPARTRVFYIIGKVVDGRIELTELMSTPGGEPRHCFRFADLNYKPQGWELLYCQSCMEELWTAPQENHNDSNLY